LNHEKDTQAKIPHWHSGPQSPTTINTGLGEASLGGSGGPVLGTAKKDPEYG
jgi:hypothetical protein